MENRFFQEGVKNFFVLVFGKKFLFRVGQVSVPGDRFFQMSVKVFLIWLNIFWLEISLSWGVPDE